MSKAIQAIGKRQNELDKFIRQYASDKGILPIMLWCRQESQAGREWKSRYDDYQLMYYNKVVSPATKLFNTMHKDQFPSGTQLDFILF